MRCSQCGTEVADGLASCPACGVVFDDASRSAGAPGGQPTSPEGRQSRSAQSTGGTASAPAGGTGGGTDPGRQGAPAGGQDSPTGGQSSLAGGQHSPAADSRAEPTQQPRQRGQRQGATDGLGALYRTYLSDLPILGGLVAGASVYVVGFLVTAAVGFVVVEAAGGTIDLDVVSELFYNAQFTTLTDRDVTFSQLPATLGLVFVFVPYMLFVAGARFGHWQAGEGVEPVEQVLAGATVVAGYLPAMAIGTALSSPGPDLFPPRYASILVTAGVLYPVICGGFGGATAAFFGAFGGVRARTTGALLGVAGFVATYAVAFLSVDTSAQSELLTLGLVSAQTYLAGHLFAIDGEGLWVLAMVVPLVLVAGTGYLRAWRAEVGEPLDAVRAGGAIAFGYSSVALFALLVVAVLRDFGSEIAGELNAVSLAALADATQQLTLEATLSPPQFVEWFVVVGVCYPLVIAAGGGLAHLLVQRTLSGSASETTSP